MQNLPFVIGLTYGILDQLNVKLFQNIQSYKSCNSMEIYIISVFVSSLQFTYNDIFAHLNYHHYSQYFHHIALIEECIHHNHTSIDPLHSLIIMLGRKAFGKHFLKLSFLAWNCCLEKWFLKLWMNWWLERSLVSSVRPLVISIKFWVLLTTLNYRPFCSNVISIDKGSRKEHFLVKIWL